MKIREIAQWCAVLISLVAVAFASGCGSPTQAQSSSPSSQVLVVNSASQPVPVAAQGTASVSITNSSASPIPVAPQGTANVNIANQAVHTLDASAQNSFYASGSCNWANNAECQVIPLLNVPANQTAVVQYVSGLCQLNSGSQIVFYELTNEQSATGNLFLTPSATAPYNGGVATAFNENVRTYFHGGTSGVTVIFDAFATAAETNSNDICSVNASGYFVAVP